MRSFVRCLEPPWQVRKIDECPLGESIPYTCTWKIEKEKWTAFCPSPIGNEPIKTTREKRTAFCPSFIQNNYSETYTLERLMPFAPPPHSFGIYGIWSSIFHLCPSPKPLWDKQGMGHSEVEVKDWLVSLAGTSKRQNWI